MSGVFVRGMKKVRVGKKCSMVKYAFTILTKLHINYSNTQRDREKDRHGEIGGSGRILSFAYLDWQLWINRMQILVTRIHNINTTDLLCYKISKSRVYYVATQEAKGREEAELYYGMCSKVRFGKWWAPSYKYTHYIDELTSRTSTIHMLYVSLANTKNTIYLLENCPNKLFAII